MMMGITCLQVLSPVNQQRRNKLNQKRSVSICFDLCQDLYTYNWEPISATGLIETLFAPSTMEFQISSCHVV